MYGWLTDSLYFWFGHYPYICLTIMIAGLCCRYLNAPGTWNSHSTELMEKKLLRVGSPLFHLGVLLAIGGHAAGLLMPDGVWVWALGSTEVHEEIAFFAGKFVAVFMFLGLGLLLGRRLANARVRAVSNLADYLVITMISVNIITGSYQVFVVRAPLFSSAGPWLRGLLSFNPDPSLMGALPLFMQVHVIMAFALFAVIPFSRLVHILSAPLTYAIRPYIVFRKRHESL